MTFHELIKRHLRNLHEESLNFLCSVFDKNYSGMLNSIAEINHYWPDPSINLENKKITPDLVAYSKKEKIFYLLDV